MMESEILSNRELRRYSRQIMIPEIKSVQPFPVPGRFEHAVAGKAPVVQCIQDINCPAVE